MVADKIYKEEVAMLLIDSDKQNKDGEKKGEGESARAESDLSMPCKHGHLTTETPTNPNTISEKEG